MNEVCPRGCLGRITNPGRHEEWHAEVVEQGGPDGVVNIDTLRASKGFTADPTMLSPNDHKKREKDVQSGKSSPGWRREASR